MITNVAPQQSPVYPAIRCFIQRNRMNNIGAFKVMTESNIGSSGSLPRLYTNLFLAASALREYGRNQTIIELTHLLTMSTPMMHTATIHIGNMAESDKRMAQSRR